MCFFECFLGVYEKVKNSFLLSWGGGGGWPTQALFLCLCGFFSFQREILPPFLFFLSSSSPSRFPRCLQPVTCNDVTSPLKPKSGLSGPPAFFLPLASGHLEAIEVHHLGPRRHEVFHKLLLRVARRIDFREGPQLRVRTEDQVDAGAGPLDLHRSSGRALRRRLQSHWSDWTAAIACSCRAG